MPNLWVAFLDLLRDYRCRFFSRPSADVRPEPVLEFGNETLEARVLLSAPVFVVEDGTLHRGVVEGGVVTRTTFVDDFEADPATHYDSHVLYGDFASPDGNPDGLIDVAVLRNDLGTNFNENNWLVYRSNGDQPATLFDDDGNGANEADWRFQIGLVQGAVAGDFNGDGLDDVALLAPGGNWHVGLSNGTGFNDSTVWGGIAAGGDISLTDFLVGDFNNDDLDDIALRRLDTGDGQRQNSGRWHVLESTGSGFVDDFYGRWGHYGPGGGDWSTWYDVGTGDFNNDGFADIVGRTIPGTVWVGLSNGTHFITQNWTRDQNRGALGAGTYADVTVIDVDGDSDDDVVMRAATGHWEVLRSNGVDNFTHGNWSRWNQSTVWSHVSVADFDGDGRADIAGMTNLGHWWLGTSNATRFVTSYHGQWTVTPPTEAQAVARLLDGLRNRQLTGTGNANAEGAVTLTDPRAEGGQFATSNYFAAYGLLGLLAAIDDPDVPTTAADLEIIRKWLVWSHVTQTDGGFWFEWKGAIDLATGLATITQTDRVDAVDSSAAMYLWVLGRFHAAGGVVTADMRTAAEKSVDAIEALKQDDGLTWALDTDSGRTRFLLDNFEVEQGLLAVVPVFSAAGNTTYANRASALATGVTTGLEKFWEATNTNQFAFAIQTNAATMQDVYSGGLRRLYPEALANLFGVAFLRTEPQTFTIVTNNYLPDPSDVRSGFGAEYFLPAASAVGGQTEAIWRARTLQDASRFSRQTTETHRIGTALLGLLEGNAWGA